MQQLFAEAGPQTAKKHAGVNTLDGPHTELAACGGRGGREAIPCSLSFILVGTPMIIVMKEAKAFLQSLPPEEAIWVLPHHSSSPSFIGMTRKNCEERSNVAIP